jgi:hypothetical protein
MRIVIRSRRAPSCLAIINPLFHDANPATAVDALCSLRACPEFGGTHPLVFGVQFGGNTLLFGLHVGIFPLWIPVVFVAQRMSSGAGRKDFWKIALSGCPSWMRFMTYGFFICAFVNFAIFIVLMRMHSPPKGAIAPPAEVLPGFSGYWMAFYSAGQYAAQMPVRS